MFRKIETEAEAERAALISLVLSGVVAPVLVIISAVLVVIGS